jgi:hypothetical protein
VPVSTPVTGGTCQGISTLVFGGKRRQNRTADASTEAQHPLPQVRRPLLNHETAFLAAHARHAHMALCLTVYISQLSADLVCAERTLRITCQQ